MKTLFNIIFVLATFLTFTRTSSQVEELGDEDDVSVILKKSQSAVAQVSPNEDSSSRKKKICMSFVRLNSIWLSFVTLYYMYIPHTIKSNFVFLFSKYIWCGKVSSTSIDHLLR